MKDILPVTSRKLCFLEIHLELSIAPASFPVSGFFLGKKMIVSRCCKQSVHVVSGEEGTSYYACDACRIACDTMVSFLWNDLDNDDARHEVTS